MERKSNFEIVIMCKSGIVMTMYRKTFKGCLKALGHLETDCPEIFADAADIAIIDDKRRTMICAELALSMNEDTLKMMADKEA